MSETPPCPDCFEGVMVSVREEPDAILYRCRDCNYHLWDRTVGQVRRMTPDPFPSREDLHGALVGVLSNSNNYPDPIAMLGKDTAPLREKVVDAVMDLLARGPRRTTEQETP